MLNNAMKLLLRALAMLFAFTAVGLLIIAIVGNKSEDSRSLLGMAYYQGLIAWGLWYWSSSADRASAMRNLLQVTSPAVLPRICIRCAKEENLEQVKETLNYLKPSVFLWLVLSPLPFVIAYQHYREKIEITFAYCNSCASRIRKWAIVSKWAWVLFFLSIVILFFVTKPFIIWPTIIVMLASFLLGFFATAMKETPLSVKKYQKPFFFIKVISSATQAKLLKS